MTELLGTVLERDGAVYRVATDQGQVRAVLRGKAKRDRDKVVVGDRVRLDREDGGLLGIVGTEPRATLLERRVPEGRGARPVVANIDQVLVVASTVDPVPIPQLIDRLLVVAEVNDLAAGVVVNKVDLAPGEALLARARAAGYPAWAASARTGDGLAQLRSALAGKSSVVTGPSGVGKSSLLNAIEPGLRLRTGEISAKIRRGKNTTVGSVMLPLEGGGYLVDTPGFSEVGLWGVDPRELGSCFPEFRPLLGECRYADCRHRSEPGCRIRDAVECGAIAPDRYESYLVLLDELANEPAEWE